MSKVSGDDINGPGVEGDSTNGPGVFGESSYGPGVVGYSIGGAGLEGISEYGTGVEGASYQGKGLSGTSQGGIGVQGVSYQYDGTGVQGVSNHGTGVHGESNHGIGIRGESDVMGVYGASNSGTGVGVHGQSYDSGTGVEGIGFTTGTGIMGYSERGTGIAATSEFGTALSVTGNSDAPAIHVTAGQGNSAIFAEVPPQAWGLYTIASGDGRGVYANSQNGVALHGSGDFGTGVIAESEGGVALQVFGRIQVRGTENPLTQIVGVTTLRKGDTSVVVTTPAVTAESLVLLTPHANPGGQLWVDVKTGIFAIQTSAAPTQDVPIAYLIIN